MFFLLTRFIYPIKEKITLSNHFELYFDNPRTEEELKLIIVTIEKAWNLGEVDDFHALRRFPMENEIEKGQAITFESIIKKFVNTHSLDNTETKDILNNKAKIINFFAKYWVIIRYENEEIVTAENKSKFEHLNFQKDKRLEIFLLDSENIFEKRENQAVSFCALISLLSNKEEYFGWNFLINETANEFFIEKSASIKIMDCIMYEMIALSPKKENDPANCQFYFDEFIGSIKEYIADIDNALKEKTIDERKIIYIGDILRLSKPHTNKFSSLIRIVGILEMLLTHNPDTGRFNVEDSISKQFVLKTSILVHEENQNINLNDTKNKLKTIYNQRSNIAHGNFEEIDKFENKIKKEGKYFDDLITNAYYFSKIAIIKYIRDPQYVNFLKNN